MMTILTRKMYTKNFIQWIRAEKLLQITMATTKIMWKKRRISLSCVDFQFYSSFYSWTMKREKYRKKKTFHVRPFRPGDFDWSRHIRRRFGSTFCDIVTADNFYFTVFISLFRSFVLTWFTLNWSALEVFQLSILFRCFGGN